MLGSTKAHATVIPDLMVLDLYPTLYTLHTLIYVFLADAHLQTLPICGASIQRRGQGVVATFPSPCGASKYSVSGPESSTNSPPWVDARVGLAAAAASWWCQLKGQRWWLTGKIGH